MTVAIRTNDPSPTSYKTTTMRDQRTPTNLLLAVSHAAVQRQQDGKQQREEVQDLEREWEEQHVQRPQRELEEEEEARIRELVTDMFKHELEAWRQERDKKARVDYLSRAEVDEEVLRMVEEVHRVTGLGRRRMEDGTEEPHDVWRKRMLALRGQIYKIWNDNWGRIIMALPRYVEGNPVRESIDPPKFVSEKRQKMSGLGVCLQCEVKGLGCSRGVVTGKKSGKLLKKEGCTRCERAGHRCIVEYEVEVPVLDSDEEEGKDGEKSVKKYIWDWADESDTEPVVEALEMWERRRRGAKLELVGGTMEWIEAGGFAPRGRDKDS
ncbi:hypothetical protein ACHAQJ_005441 [Trichoderma viride]